MRFWPFWRFLGLFRPKPGTLGKFLGQQLVGNICLFWRGILDPRRNQVKRTRIARDMTRSWCQKGHFTWGSKTCFAHISFKSTLYKNQSVSKLCVPGGTVTRFWVFFWHYWAYLPRFWTVSDTSPSFLDRFFKPIRPFVTPFKPHRRHQDLILRHLNVIQGLWVGEGSSDFFLTLRLRSKGSAGIYDPFLSLRMQSWGPAGSGSLQPVFTPSSAIQRVCGVGLQPFFPSPSNATGGSVGGLQPLILALPMRSRGSENCFETFLLQSRGGFG